MNKPNPTEFRSAYGKLPIPLKEFLADPGNLSEFYASIQKRCGLSDAVHGHVRELISYLLVGLLSQSQLLQALQDSGLSPSVANAIVADINAELVPRLKHVVATWKPDPHDPQDEEDHAFEAVGSALRASAPQPKTMAPAPSYMPPKPPVAVSAPAPRPVTPPAPPRPAPVAPPVAATPKPEQQRPQAPAYAYTPPSTVIPANPALPPRSAQIADSMMRYTPLPKQPPIPKPMQSQSTPAVSPAADPFRANRAERVGAPTHKPMVGSDHMLADHEEPSPMIHHAPAPTPASIQRARTSPPPPNLPGMMPPASSPRPTAPAPRPPLTAPMPPPPRSPVTRPPGVGNYSNDPYREPFDESPAA